MDLKSKCEQVMKDRGWSNEQLAEAIGMTPPNLSSAKAGRRAMPYQALIKLEKLRGMNDSEIVNELLRIAACVALAVVTLFVTAPLNTAEASTAYRVAEPSNTNYGGLWSRITATAKRLLRAAADSAPNAAHTSDCSGSTGCD